MTFDEMCEFEVLYNAFLAARRGKRSKYSAAQYEANVLQLTERLSYILRTRKYVPRKFEVFYVREPKLRLVQAPAFVDKVVQHALVDNILYEAITHSFILDNYASQRDKGAHYGLSRLRSAMLSYFRSRKGKDEEYRAENGYKEHTFRCVVVLYGGTLHFSCGLRSRQNDIRRRVGADL